MIWAAGALVLFSSGKAALDTAGTLMVGQISRSFMGSIGGYLAIIGVIALPITSGDTAFRSLRLIVSEELNIDQKSGVKRASVAAVLFIPAIIILVFAKSNPNGFNILWRYFGFTNQFVAIFALGVATTYLITKNKNYLMTLIPGIFYAFIVFSFIISAKEIGFGLDLKISYILGAIIAVLYGVFIVKNANKRRNEIKNIVLD